MFFRDKVQEVEGYILSVRKNAFLILIPKFGLESILYLPKTESPVKFIYSDEVLKYYKKRVFYTIFFFYFMSFIPFLI